MVTANTHALRIFLVENNEDTLKYFRMYLEDMGHRVEVARTVEEAFMMIPEAGCDVLIADIGLEDGTGWELLRRLKKSGREHPRYAIAMSGFGMNTDKLTSEAAGFRHHMLKPLETEELDEMLEEAARERWG